MSAVIIAAGIAAGTPFTLLAMAYLAAASAYRQQIFQEEETARLWTYTPQPIAPAVIMRAAARGRASCPAIAKAPEPRLRRAAGGRRH